MVVRKMKEKCKDAARMRREKERLEFVELSKLLPLPSSTTSQLDKASIIRLTSSYLRMRQAFPQGLGANWGSRGAAIAGRQQQQPQPPPSLAFARPHRQQPQQQQQVRELGSLLLQTLDGFVFALHADGKIMYISETASVHLGLPQIDLTGSSLFEFVHPADHEEVRRALGLDSEGDRRQVETMGDTCELPRSFCMRMKCILPKRNAGLASAGYKAIHCHGYLKLKPKLIGHHQNPISNATTTQQAPQQPQLQQDWESYALVAVGHSLLPSAITEVKLTASSFMFRANLDLRIYYIEASIVHLLGFEQMDMVGISLYQFVHAQDIGHLEGSHRSLLEKGQAVTRYYRLMKRCGGSIWCQSYATLVNNPRNISKPQHIISVCVVIANDELDGSCISSERSLLNTALPNRANADVQVERATTANDTLLWSMDNEMSSNGIEGSMEQRVQDRKPARKLAAVACDETALNSSKRCRRLKVCEADEDGDVLHSLQQKNDYSKDDHHHWLPRTMVTSQAQPIVSIGLLRRPSDDSCSVVSSVASTSTTSSTSSHLNSDFSNYIIDNYNNQTNATPTTNNDPLQFICFDAAANTKTQTQHQSLPPTTMSAVSDCTIYDNYLLYRQPNLCSEPTQVCWPEQTQQQPIMITRADKNVYDTNPMDSFNNNLVSSTSSLAGNAIHSQTEAHLMPQVVHSNHNQQLVIDIRHTANLTGSSLCSNDDQLLLSSSSHSDTSPINQQHAYHESPPYRGNNMMLTTPPSIQYHHQHQVPINNSYTMSSM